MQPDTEEKSEGTLTDGLICFLPKPIICSDSVCIFPLGRFVFTPHYGIADQSTHPRKGFPYALYLTASDKLVALCIVRQLHDNNNNKMSRALTWCSDEVKGLIVR